METRKLQEVGGGTYTVSIPKEWATSRGLEAGTPVDLYTHLDGSIVVRNHATDDETLATAQIAVDGGTAEATRTLRAAQVVGFERVTLVSETPFCAETRRAVRSLVRDLVGTELVEEDARELTVQNLLEPAGVSVGQSVVQLQYVSLCVHRQAVAAFVDGDDGVCERIREREAEVEQLCEMIVRHFSRALVSFEEVDSLGTTRAELFVYYETARQLRQIARAGVEVSRASEQLSDDVPAAVSEELVEVAESIRRVVEDAANAALNRRDIDEVTHVFDAIDDTRADVEAFDEALVEALVEKDVVGRQSVEEVVAVARVLDSLGRTLEQGRAICDTALQAAVRAEH